MLTGSLASTSSGRVLSSQLRAGFDCFFPSRAAEAIEVQERCQFHTAFENYFNTIKFICSRILYKKMSCLLLITGESFQPWDLS